VSGGLGSSKASIVVVALVAAIIGGVTSLAIGTTTGWIGDAETVVVERAAPIGGDTPPEPAANARPLPGNRFDPAAIYRQRSSGVVTIYALFDGHAGGDVAAQAQGSGFVVSDQGYVLTNSHVITTAGETGATVAADPASEVFVEFTDGDRVPASIVGWDPFSDVGVVEVDPAEHALDPVPLGDSSTVAVGEPVAAIGSPFGQVSSLAVGVVSAIERSVSSLTSVYNVIDAIQTDAPINRGNSGGPLFNSRGEVIGISAQIRSETGAAEGVGFAIPINIARRSMRQLIDTGEVRYAWVGVSTQTLTPSIAEELEYPVERGAVIQSVVPGSPAEEAGLIGGNELGVVDGLEFRRGGDVIVAIQGRRVENTEDLVRIVGGELFPGEAVEFTLIRDGERLVVPVVLAERPANPDAAR
jgi:2-alkenal reductase